MTARARQGTVLNVNDNEPARYTLSCTLREAGFEVVEAATGGEALEKAAGAIDLVLLDLHLPDIDGFEVCRRLKAASATSSLPVLTISAIYTRPEHWVRALDYGGDAYLSQPADPAVLATTVRTLIRVGRLEDERRRLLLEKEARLAELESLSEALRIGEERFRVALKNSPIAVYSQDEDLRYTWAYNPLPGFEAAAVPGTTDADLVAPDELPLLTEPKRRVLATGAGLRQEIDLTVKGERRFYDIHLEPLRGGCGKVVGLTGSAVDVTDARRLEAKLREKQRLESIGLLAGGVAHDFNNLLTSILGNTSIVADELGPDHPLQARVAEIIEGSERAAALTTQLLAYAGKGRLIMEPVDLSALVKSIVSLLASSIPKQIRLDLTLRGDLRPVYGDAGQIQQVVMNLVLNSAEAIGEETEGTIRINTGAQEIGPLYIQRNSVAAQNEIAPGPYVYIEVRDTGCGMSKEVRSRIFDPFFTTKFTGRGLGLAAVQGIVRGHRGTIELYSTPGQGTTFKVLFPAARAAEASRLPDAAAMGGSGTVLIVDDEAFVRELARTVLEKNGYSVLLAADGAGAVETFEANKDRISAVLLDISMPGKSGGEVYGIIRRLRPDIRVILSSGYNETEIMRGFPPGHGLFFLQKPYTSGRLVEKVRAAFA